MPDEKTPVRCVICKSAAVFLTTVPDENAPRGYRWRYTCLDDGSSWWVDEHGGTPDDYVRREQ